MFIAVGACRRPPPPCMRRTSRASSGRLARYVSRARRGRPTHAEVRRRDRLRRLKAVSAESIRPGSRVVISCNSHPLPSGSLKVTKER